MICCLASHTLESRSNWRHRWQTESTEQCGGQRSELPEYWPNLTHYTARLVMKIIFLVYSLILWSTMPALTYMSHPGANVTRLIWIYSDCCLTQTSVYCIFWGLQGLCSRSEVSFYERDDRLTLVPPTYPQSPPNSLLACTSYSIGMATNSIVKGRPQLTSPRLCGLSVWCVWVWVRVL